MFKIQLQISSTPTVYRMQRLIHTWAIRPISMGFHRVSWVLNTMTWHCINEERGAESFMGVETVSQGHNSSTPFPKYEYVENQDMKPPLRLT